MGTFLLWFQGDTFNVVQHTGLSGYRTSYHSPAKS